MLINLLTLSLTSFMSNDLSLMSNVLSASLWKLAHCLLYIPLRLVFVLHYFVRAIVHLSVILQAVHVLFLSSFFFSCPERDPVPRKSHVVLLLLHTVPLIHTVLHS